MNIFISHANCDKEKVDRLAIALKEKNHNVWYDAWELEIGDNLLEKISEGIASAETIFIVVSQESLKSKWLKKEIDTIAMLEVAKHTISVITLLIDPIGLPSYLSNYPCVDISGNFEEGIKTLSETVYITASEESKKLHAKYTMEKNVQKHINHMSSELRAGKLSVVCGAGVSIDAGVPSWNKLLIELLQIVTDRLSKENLDFKKIDPDYFNEKYATSSLVIGRYLKNNLGKDFFSEVRNTLYMDEPKECDLINALVELARPQRNAKPLDSIITFNFDGLIEENLENNNIIYSSIYKEGMRIKTEELPIYHVHGYLPRVGTVTEDNGVVFSEDSYHNQFIEPFSWSNLIQLNKLSQMTCLLVGLSMTDPNLRRLLDVANRKNSDKELNHFIIKKSPVSFDKMEPVDELAKLLEEQDANELGLNVLWVDDFSEIPDIIRKIGSHNSDF